MTTLEGTLATLTPLLVTGYDTRQQSANVLHEIIGRSAPDVTLRAAHSRTGVLSLLFADAGDAEEARDELATPQVWELTDTDVPEIDMQFVVTEDIEVKLDSDTRTLWLVAFKYREVMP